MYSIISDLIKTIIILLYKRKARSSILMYDLCKRIKPYKCAFVKTEVPYMPDDFPYSIPLGKDADIICQESDYEDICYAIKMWCQSIPHSFTIKIVDESFGRRTRICGLLGVLFYQIDVCWKVDGLTNGYIEDAISNKIDCGEYFILSGKYEYIYRAYAFSQKRKPYHREYLINHFDDYDKTLLEKHLVGLNIDELLKS